MVVDFRAPVQAVIPGAQGRILGVLAQTTADLNLRTVARLSDVSVAQASRVMPTLVELGLVERREVPPSALFRMVRDHVAARAVGALVDLRSSVLQELAASVGDLAVPPASLVVFGSFARGDADRTSDLDFLLVRPVGVDEDDEEWRTSVGEWTVGVRRLTGNRVDLLELGLENVGAKLRSKHPLWGAISREGIVVYGQTIDDLRAWRHA